MEGRVDEVDFGVLTHVLNAHDVVDDGGEDEIVDGADVLGEVIVVERDLPCATILAYTGVR